MSDKDKNLERLAEELQGSYKNKKSVWGDYKLSPGGLEILPREKAEREIINRALVASDTNVTRAAKLLGISRPTLYELMKSLGMKA